MLTSCPASGKLLGNRKRHHLALGFWYMYRFQHLISVLKRWCPIQCRLKHYALAFTRNYRGSMEVKFHMNVGLVIRKHLLLSIPHVYRNKKSHNREGYTKLVKIYGHFIAWDLHLRQVVHFWCMEGAWYFRTLMFQPWWKKHKWSTFMPLDQCLRCIFHDVVIPFVSTFWQFRVRKSICFLLP